MRWLADARTKRKSALGQSGKVRLGTVLVLAGLALVGIAVSVELLSRSRTPSKAEIAGMNSGQLTKYVFGHQGCDSCHTLSPNFQLGLTDRGQQLAKNFEGCAGLLTAMNVVGELPPADRSPDETQVAQKFQEFGCETCHQIIPGKMALTDYGMKMKSLHAAACTTDACCAVPRK
jgi:cytochrome c551/c552